ncbi:MAG TPA: hypothetical protein VJ656_14165 [Pyrinomonadaceae bacterium]|nr:hypothetical protein [Pyrinomonadaceae bacterium]
MDATKSTKGDLKHYVIRGGAQGRERLKLLSRVSMRLIAMTIAGTPRIVQAWGRKPVDQ